MSIEEAALAKRPGTGQDTRAGAGGRGAGLSRGQAARALRYSLDRYLEDGAGGGLEAHVRRTAAEHAKFHAMVAERAFELVYQPVVSLQDGALHHFEALARFEGDESPARAILFAEALDIILGFDLAVAAMAAEALAAAPPEVSIAVNVSALSLMAPGFVEAFEAAVAPAPGPPGRLMVEVTETQAMGDLDRANAVIAALRKGGRPVCLDDFGAGAATLECLRRLDLDFVKIDGRYVRQAEADPRDALILKHLVALCRDLSVATIAEMVETPGSADLLRGLGVDLGQGFAFSRPLPEPRWTPGPG